MGVVYEAIQSPLDRSVALKVLPIAAAADPRQFERFQLEARAAASLRHPHIVPVYGVGCEDEVPYYAMQFIDGRSLAEILLALRMADGLDVTNGDRSDPDPDALTQALAADLTRIDHSLSVAELPGERSRQSERTVISTVRPVPSARPRCRPYCCTIASLGLQVAESLARARSREPGVIHRDIKPGNLLLDRQGHLWVSDFGLARFLGDARLTQSGPIWWEHFGYEPRASVWASSGNRRPHRRLFPWCDVVRATHPSPSAAFDGTGRAAILDSLARGKPNMPRRLNTAIPRDLETIVLKAMAREPAGTLSDRPATSPLTLAGSSTAAP